MGYFAFLEEKFRERIDKTASGVSYTDYLLRFRSLSNQQLQDKQSALEAQETIFSQQAMGSKSMTRDLRLLQDQLNAIAYVLRERGYTVIIPAPLNPNIGVTDFSQIR